MSNSLQKIKDKRDKYKAHALSMKTKDINNEFDANRLVQIVEEYDRYDKAVKIIEAIS